MSTVIIEEDPSYVSFQSTSEVKLEIDVIEVEANDDYKYEENVESLHIKSELENYHSLLINSELENDHSGHFSRSQELKEENIDEVVDVKANIAFLKNPVVVLTRLEQHQIKDDKICGINEDKRNEDELCKCDVCARAFGSKEILNEHVFCTHRGMKLYECTVYNEGFKQPHHLSDHQLIHTGVKAFPCHFCGKTYCQKRNLKNHINMHNKINIYEPNRGLLHSSRLHKHKQRFIGDRPFSCDLCKKTFSRKNHLKVHSHIHSGIKPYVCNICNRGFSYPSSLYYHESTHIRDDYFLTHFKDAF